MSLVDWQSEGAYNTAVPVSNATGWPTIAEAAVFVSVDPADPTLIDSLAKSISYGGHVLGDNFVGDVPDSVRTACLEYTGACYTERIGHGETDFMDMQGSISLSRYRRTLLSARFVAIA
jgi:hypothetical protein